MKTESVILLLQAMVFPLLGALWWSINNRMARFEDRTERVNSQMWEKIETLTSETDCAERRREINRRLVALETGGP